jgi:integrase/recombinase XerD
MTEQAHDGHEAIASWVASLGSPNTRAAYERDIRLFARWMSTSSRPLRRANSVDIERFRASRVADGEATSTVNRRLAAVASFYRHVDATGANPVDGARRSRTPSRIDTPQFTGAQALDIWRAAEALGHKTAVIVGLVLFDGLKTVELLLLDVDDIEIQRDRVTATITRSNRELAVVLDRRTAAALRRHVTGRRVGPLLMGENPTRAPARLTRFGVDYLIKRTGALAGLAEPLTVNSLRSAWRSDADPNGVGARAR